MNNPGRHQPQPSAWRGWARFFTKALAGLVLLIALAVVFLFVYPSTRPPTRTVRPLGTISVDVPFRFTRAFIDYMTLEGPTLYVAFASHDLVGLIDTRTSRGIGAVGQLPRVHGITLVPERNLAFTSNGGDNTIGIFDLAHRRLLRKTPGGGDPDAILYDARPRLIYVADHDGKTATLLDPASGGMVAIIPLGGKPEYCQADPESGLVYQNLQDTSEVVVVDPVKRAVIRRYKLYPGQGPTGLAFDAGHHRLFSATGNRKLVVLNSDTGEFLAALPIGWGVDGAAYDSELRRVYTANGLGSMTVIRQDSPDRYHVLEDAPTRELGNKEFYTLQEMAAYEKKRAQDLNRDRRDGSADADLGRAYNEAWFDRGAHLASDGRTSRLIDPPNGRFPAMTPAAATKYERRALVAGPARQ